MSRFDFSAARARLIASVPGRHSGAALHSFGLHAVKRALCSEAHDARFAANGTLVYQCSSLNSMGSNEQLLSFADECFGAGATAGGAPLGVPPPSRNFIVWPTAHETRTCLFGWGAGDSLPANPTLGLATAAVRARLCRWRPSPSVADATGARRCTSRKRVRWFLLWFVGG